jgi:hypothetical protein
VNFIDTGRNAKEMSDRDAVMNVIQSLFFIDVGIVSSIYNHNAGDGGLDGVYVDVTFPDKTIATGVEVMLIGNQDTAIDTEIQRGHRVLCFGMRTGVTSLENMIPSNKSWYGSSFLKCIPVAAPRGAAARVSLADGAFSVAGESSEGLNAAGEYRKRIGEELITEEKPDGTYIREEGLRSFIRYKEGNVFITEEYLYDNDTSKRKILYYKSTREDTGATVEKFNEITDLATDMKDKKWAMEKERLPSGYSVEAYKDAKGKILYQREIAANGTVTVSRMEQESGFLSVTTASPDGGVSRVQKNQSNQTVHTVSVDATGETKIKVGNGEKGIISITEAGVMEITHGGFTLNGSVAPNATAGGPFCALPNCLFSGAPHVGNKAVSP